MRIYARGYRFGGESDPDRCGREAKKWNPSALVQAVDAKAAVNGAFVEMLAAQTFSAKAGGVLLARKPEIDLLLRLSGTTQISEAIRRHGARKGEPFLLVVARPEREVEGRWPGVRRLPRRRLTREEFDRVEVAALLNLRS
jgi:tRNA threonylcarbamoyladenosine modification (KEOPS) complex Cgi121 subunit